MSMLDDCESFSHESKLMGQSSSILPDRPEGYGTKGVGQSRLLSRTFRTSSTRDSSRMMSRTINKLRMW